MDPPKFSGDVKE
jgi:hypothetical protein